MNKMNLKNLEKIDFDISHVTSEMYPYEIYQIIQNEENEYVKKECMKELLKIIFHPKTKIQTTSYITKINK